MDYCNSSICEDDAYSLHVNSPCLNHELWCMRMNESSADKTAFTSLLSTLDHHSEVGTLEEGSAMFEEVSIAFAKMLHIRVSEGLPSRKSVIPSQCEAISINDGVECQEVKFNKFDIASFPKKRLERCATFPCSVDMKSADAPVSTISISFASSEESQNCQDLIGSGSVKTEKATCSRSVSLPSASKLVSAMKGGRERQGTPKEKLHVKWAPDVYDPPVTSMVHTVKSHQKRPKAKRKDKHKHKQKGSRSTRGSASERQRSSQIYSTTCDTFNQIRLRPPADQTLLDGFSAAAVEMEYATGGNESKCGSSFLTGSLTKMQFPAAEAL